MGLPLWCSGMPSPLTARSGPQLRTIISRHKLIGLCLGRPALVVALPELGPRAQSGKPAWGLIGFRAGPHLPIQHCMGVPERSPRRARWA